MQILCCNRSHGGEAGQAAVKYLEQCIVVLFFYLKRSLQTTLVTGTY